MNFLLAQPQRRLLRFSAAWCLAFLAASPARALVTTEGDASVNIPGQGNVVIGTTSAGIVTVDGGSHLPASQLVMGDSFAGSGQLDISGFGSQVSVVSRNSIIGAEGVGRINVTDGARLSTTALILGAEPTGYGEVNISGFGASWIHPQSPTNLTVGQAGRGVVTANDGARVQTGQLIIGEDSQSQSGPSNGRVTVVGAGTHWQNFGPIAVGVEGDGALAVLDGATFDAGQSFVNVGGSSLLARGSLAVSGGGSHFNYANTVRVTGGQAKLNIAGGGVMQGAYESQLYLAANQTGSAEIEVVGAESQFRSYGDVLVVGDSLLNVRDGGTFTANNLAFNGDQSHHNAGTVVVDGPGSTLNVLTPVLFGDGRRSPVDVTVSNGGRIGLPTEQYLGLNAIRLGRESRLHLADGEIGGQPFNNALTSEGYVTGSGRITMDFVNETAGRLAVGSNERLQIGGQLRNEGAVVVNGGALHVGGGSSTAGLIRLVNAELHMEDRRMDLFVQPNGRLELAGESVAVSGTVNVGADSSMNLEAGVSGQFDRYAYINGSLTLEAGATAHFAEDFYQQNPASLTLALTAASGATQDAPIEVGRFAGVSGRLTAYFDDLYQPTLGDAFPILASQTSMDGVFQQTDLPELSQGLAWVVDYSDALRVTLRVVDQFGGDFDSNGLVAAGDLAAWQSGFGHAGMTHAAGDANGDGAVDGGDFLNWQRGYRTTTAAVNVAVPEPAAVALALAAVLTGVGRIAARRNATPWS